MIKNIDVVLGCSYGDEGKGKVVHDLLTKNNYDLCIRFNGSGNAGHTIYYKGKEKVVLHQIPIGILHDNVTNLISSDCLVNIPKLKEELDSVKKLGINITNKLFISKGCHIITQEAIEYDRQNNTIGTTNSGIGPTYANKMLRIGRRVEDFKKELTDLGVTIIDMRNFWSSPYTENVENILLEGAQGFELDINWTNNYPYCTSSTCTLAGGLNTGIPIKKIRNIYGISKIYDTYVGTRQFQPENDKILHLIGSTGREFGATTGRKRQCNYLNLDNLIEALKINQANICIINKVDILEEVSKHNETSDVFKLYHLGTLIKFQSLEDMKTYISNALKFIQVIYSSNPYSI
jgi:adenylosuccinate synthase